jgi:hypothetical protein
MQPIKRKLEIAMKKPDYYPFDKPADKLDIDDLSVLKLIPENWFIEYKRQVIDRTKLAKEICAFANQNGGYIFFGIGETNSKEKLAGDFIGISPQETPQIIHTIELAVSTDCHPAVPVEIISIHGKGNNIGMPEENVILMIIVPRSEDTPHIHCSGVIYQRIADSSAPVRDNHELSKLIDRRDEHQKNIERALTRRLYLNDDSKNTPFLFMNILPTEKEKAWGELSLEKLTEMLVEANTGNGALKFDKSDHIDGGMRFTQRVNNIPTIPMAALNIYLDGSARFDIPLNTRYLYNQPPPKQDFSKFLRYLSICEKQDFPKDTKIIDYSYLFIVLNSFIRNYLFLTQKLSTKSDFYYGFELINISYSAFYMNSEGFLNVCETRGVPFNFENTIKRPQQYSTEVLENYKISNLYPDDAINKSEQEKMQLRSAMLSVRSLLPALLPLSGYNDYEQLMMDILEVKVA